MSCPVMSCLPVISCLLLQNQTLLKKQHILLLDLQCPPPLQTTMTASNKIATLSKPKLTMQQCPCGLQRISRSETSICLSSPVLSCHVLSSITKSNISALLDLQCPPPLQATMTASNKVATFSNSKLTMQQCPCGLQEFPDLKLAFVCHSCPILSCHVLYNKIKHFAPRSTMSTSIASDHDSVEQSCSSVPVDCKNFQI